MRYFKTSNASRPYQTGGYTFTFEPVDQNGGIWSGVLAVVDDAAASVLAAAALPQITELTAEQYETLKKKPLMPSGSSRVLPKPPQVSLQPPARAEAAAPVAPSSSTAEEASVFLETTDAEPPLELAEDEPKITKAALKAKVKPPATKPAPTKAE